MSDPTWTPTPRRTGLQRTRDVALTVMAALVSLFVVFAFYVSFSVGSALDEVADRWNNPTPAVTFEDPVPDYPDVPTNPAGEPCIGEVPPPGC